MERQTGQDITWDSAEYPDDLRPAESGNSGFGHGKFVDSVFFDPPDTLTQEQGQAIARILFAFLGLGFLHAISLNDFTSAQFRMVLGYTLFSFAHLAFVSSYRHRFVWRRYLAVIIDFSALSILAATLPGVAIISYPIYLWILIGNGLRFGTRMLYFSALVGLAGFTAGFSSIGMLKEQPGMYVALTLGMLLMPKFFLVMIRRLETANSKLQAQKEQAEYMALHDELTGLPNRTCLGIQMKNILARARRNGNGVIVAFIDLDSFKSINDSFGHKTGNQLLEKVAATMQETLREQDLIARPGGDEFIVVAEDEPDCPNIATILDRLFSCVGRYYDLDGYKAYVTWSCGIAVYPRNGKDLYTLMQNADIAMYSAKANGTNQYAFYDSAMSERVDERRSVHDDLRIAIDQGQLRAHFQPIIDITTGKTCSAEALIRWQHPVKGLLSPFAFIEIAEQTGLIDRIGEWMLRRSLQVARQCREVLGEDFTIHVNVSAHQMQADDFADRVATILAESGMPSDAISLEVTESAFIGDARRARHMLETIKSLGIEIALDDFGTGFSSLSYLKFLPVDVIKIDKSFVDGIPQDARGMALVDSMLAIGARLDCGMIAEGVENAAQKDWLQAHGCRFMQGYYFSKPLPEEDFLALLGHA